MEEFGDSEWGITALWYGVCCFCLWVAADLVGRGQPTLLWDSVYWAGGRDSGWICVWFLSCSVCLGCVVGGGGWVKW